jgi:hypothetical protein
VGVVAKCSGIKTTGERCRNRPTTGSEYCPAHDPERAEARRESASKAGKAKGPAAELVALRGRIRRYMDDVEKGKLEKGKASVLAQLAGVAGRLYEAERRIVETEQLAEKLEALEETIEAQQQRGGFGYYGA